VHRAAGLRPRGVTFVFWRVRSAGFAKSGVPSDI